MIIETMTFSEVGKEILSDWHLSVLSKACNILSDNKYRRIILKSNKNEIMYFKRHEIISKRRNKFILIPYSNGKADFRKFGICYYAFIPFRLGNHNFYARLDNNSQAVCIYSWHLFERYYERLYGYKGQITEEYVLSFFKDNSIVLYNEQNNPMYFNGVFGKTDKGIVLGQQIDNRTIVFKTFITEEMARGKQIEKSDFLKGQLKNLVFDELGNRRIA